MAPLTAALTNLQHCQFGHRCRFSISDGEIKENQEALQSNTQAPTVSAGEPAQTARLPVERVTVKVKDPKKVAAGRAGAAARKANRERLLEQLRTAKESFRPHRHPQPCGRGQYSSKGSGLLGPGVAQQRSRPGQMAGT